MSIYTQNLLNTIVCMLWLNTFVSFLPAKPLFQYTTLVHDKFTRISSLEYGDNCMKTEMSVYISLLP